MVTIAVDAMGGDHAPGREVEGAIAAATQYGVRVLLVGKEDLVRRELERRPEARELPLEVVHASEVVTMEDAAAKSLLRKRDSSVRVAARLVKQG
ncbi:MAG: phosphate--acyl-ACP acyltransferase, partial [bacterium]|nr:phosphate--acyl-ACP acyltransferase [bacterium]